MERSLGKCQAAHRILALGVDVVDPPGGVFVGGVESRCQSLDLKSSNGSPGGLKKVEESIPGRDIYNKIFTNRPTPTVFFSFFPGCGNIESQGVFQPTKKGRPRFGGAGMMIFGWSDFEFGWSASGMFIFVFI